MDAGDIGRDIVRFKQNHNIFTRYILVEKKANKVFKGVEILTKGVGSSVIWFVSGVFFLITDIATVFGL